MALLGHMDGGNKLNLDDRNVFKRVFDDFYVALCIFTERYVGNPETACDIAQDCFIKLWQQRGNFDYLYQIKSYLYTSAKNKALNELEHQKVVSDFAGKFQKKYEESFFRDQVIEEESFRILMQAIDSLPKQTRNVMLLTIEGNSNAEIAQKLSLAESTVQTHKKIAYKKMRILLKDHFYIIPLIFFGLN